jgi:PAS domain S-box-containing protein
MFNLSSKTHCDTFTEVRLPGPLLSGLEFVPRAGRLSQAGQASFERIVALARSAAWRFPLGRIRDFLSDDQQAVVITDPRQRIQFASHGFAAMTGYQPEQVVGRTPHFLQGPATSPATRQHLREHVARQERVSGTLLNYRADGTPYQCQVVIEPIFDHTDRLVHFIAFEREVS